MKHSFTRLLAVASLVALPGRALANNVPQTLNYSQDWSTTGPLITVNDDWSMVPGVIGYLGQDITTVTGVDPQTLLTESASTGDVDVIANAAPSSGAGGVAEFDAILDPAIALQGSGTADAPYLLLHLNTTGRSSIAIRYLVRDLDPSADNAIQPVALQFRVGNTGAFTNVPAGFVADATTAGSATQVTPVSATLPPAADNVPLLQIRIITANAVGNDEWVGIDNIGIAGTAPSVCGNGMLELGESCDAGSANGTSICGCSLTCTFPAVGTVCASAAGDCDAPDVCDGAGMCRTVFAPAGTSCRAAMGACDVAEACTGLTAVCPVDGFASSAETCRASTGVCDPAETCSGGAPDCPANVLRPAGTVCAAASGDCDVADTCNGSSGACNVVVASAGTVCRATGGDCDVAEVCDGAGTSCPADAFAGAGTSCRDAAGPCDVVESCSGSSSACPSNAFRAAGTVCAASSGAPCDVDDVCSGSGAACTARVASSTVECRPSANACDVADFCDGSATSCPGSVTTCPDAGNDAGTDAGTDAGSDAGTDAGSDAGTDAGMMTGEDAGMMTGEDAGMMTGEDAGMMTGEDAGADAGVANDAGPSDAGSSGMVDARVIADTGASDARGDANSDAAGPGPDAGGPPSMAGCSCSVPQQGTSSREALSLLALLSLAGVIRRRRAKR